MKEATVTTRSERSPSTSKQVPPPMGDFPTTTPGPSEPAATLLRQLERHIDTELGPLRAGVEPLLAELRRGLTALYPTAGGLHLPPAQQEAQRTRLAQVMDSLEDILEALQRSARARRSTGSSGRTA